MARTNTAAARVKPAVSELLTLHVLRRATVSPHLVRVTLGGGDAARFRYLGFDQWFRLFIPVSQDSLARLPNKLDTIAYLKYLAISATSRPVLRNYTVRAYRADGPDGPELDVDFVLHGSAADGTAGPAASWAESCAVGDAVAIIDEGITFTPPEGLERVLIVADETGLPAVAGILASLPRGSRGHALVEIPSEADAQPLDAPDGVVVTWVARTDPHDVPGRAVLAAAQALPLGDEPFYGWVVGEQALPSALRRHWVHAGVPKHHITFTGYWKAKRHR
ncbi:Siderophore-interacting protein [Beutenbergia cavernae DSM 12333]|uniref:Siderophore-interacting protein n=1 Tax=Beutenbergia cavernae (strain ATCC BAA-8 / DSM 12333 / CCUG 43141 / JCM 11478 / NBRC 16432 / NCIMB 13614 / HKI 0122) TaxID=471853 RepID=C5BV03_BEUC1|nr:siderophore-interacting protein [Beutenbergia cavernae]ACQ78377.1 Siderophore-interacting protein [Beutenbergia cavernae DSM 12333]